MKIIAWWTLHFHQSRLTAVLSNYRQIIVKLSSDSGQIIVRLSSNYQELALRVLSSSAAGNLIVFTTATLLFTLDCISISILNLSVVTNQTHIKTSFILLTQKYLTFGEICFKINQHNTFPPPLSCFAGAYWFSVRWQNSNMINAYCLMSAH